MSVSHIFPVRPTHPTHCSTTVDTAGSGGIVWVVKLVEICTALFLPPISALAVHFGQVIRVEFVSQLNRGVNGEQ